ncbi:MAG: hypothetical protein JW797_14870 [Bradymonadales bacterium]|nr:hypothetical protein [Bradymonadales bacterium]
MQFRPLLVTALVMGVIWFGCPDESAEEADGLRGDLDLAELQPEDAEIDPAEEAGLDGEDPLDLPIDQGSDATDLAPEGGDLAVDLFPWDWDPDSAPEWPTIEPGTLEAGAASGTLDLPVGVPLACYTGRARFGGGRVEDGRSAPYAVSFIPSTGVQTRIPMHVVWLEAAGQHAVLVKIDLGYAFDGLTRALEAAVAEETGVDVSHRLFLTTSHSHSSYGDFSQAHMLFLGHDRYNREILERIAEQGGRLAATAYQAMEPAAIGVGIDPAYDPDHRIFRSRRGEHHGLVDDFGVVVGPGYKDPNLYLLRIDASQGTADPDDDEPLAILFGFGIHGTIMSIDNPLLSSESSGAIELKLENLFDRPVSAVHLQTSVGDMSPAGVQDRFARMESVGELAAPRIHALWEATRTSSDPLRLEALVRTVPMGRDIRVSRSGAVDLYYLPYDPEYRPDLVVFGEDGLSLNPYDEFIAQHGAAMCGDPELVIPVANMGVDVRPYSSCALIERVVSLFPILFETDQYYPMEHPLWEIRSTMIGALGLTSIPVTVLGEDAHSEPVAIGFFPGEVCTLLGRSFQARMEEELGIHTSIAVGVSLDHEGYLLTVEDWMRGGYEPAINAWGPLQGEYILDRLLELAELLQTEQAEHPAFPDYRHQEYPDWPLEPVVPDVSTGCGTVPEALPAYLWTRDDWRPGGVQPAPAVRRVSDIAHFVWLGGDPAVDLPVVTLQRESAPGSDEFVDVLLPNGEPLTDRGYDMILSYTPDPLMAGEEGASRHHYWMVEWQAVTDRPSLDHMAGLAEGRYRLVARGLCPDPEDDEYPFDGLGYQVASAPFEVTGEDGLEVSIASQDGNLLTLGVSYRASSRGFRLLHMASDFRTPTPLVGGESEPTATVELLAADGLGEPLQTWLDVPAVRSGDASHLQVDLGEDAPESYRLRVTDVFGNRGMY